MSRTARLLSDMVRSFAGGMPESGAIEQGSTHMPSQSDLVKADATTVVDLLRRGAVTPHDLLDALEARIAAVDGKVNALPTLCFARARAHADRLVKLPPAERGPLAGLPVPIKDLTAVAGVRTTHGSPIYADHVPARSDIMVERLEANGGIV